MAYLQLALKLSFVLVVAYVCPSYGVGYLSFVTPLSYEAQIPYTITGTRIFSLPGQLPRMTTATEGFTWLQRYKDT